MNNNSISALIVGYGSIGKRHTRNLRTLGVDDIYLCDPYIDSLTSESDLENSSGVFLDIDSALNFVNFDIALVC